MTRRRRYNTTCPWCSAAIFGYGWLGLEDSRAEHYRIVHGIKRKLPSPQ